MTKSQMMIAVKSRMNYGRASDGTLMMERSGDTATDAQRAVEQVERETGLSFGPARCKRIPQPGTRDKFSAPVLELVTPQSEIIDDLSTYYSDAPLDHSGHSISIPLHLNLRLVMVNGVPQTDTPQLSDLAVSEYHPTVQYIGRLNRPTPHAHTISGLATGTPVADMGRPLKYSTTTPVIRGGKPNASYQTTMKRPAVQPSIDPLRWSEDLPALRQWLNWMDVYRTLHHSNADRVIPQLAPRHAQGTFCDPNENPRTSAMIARTRQDVEANQRESDAIIARLRADLASIKSDTPVIPPAVPPVQPGPVWSATFATLRPRAKWFLSNPPVMALGVAA